MLPLAVLSKNNTKIIWEQSQKHALLKIKLALTSPSILKPFQVNHETRLSVGFALSALLE